MQQDSILSPKTRSRHPPQPLQSEPTRGNPSQTHPTQPPRGNPGTGLPVPPQFRHSQVRMDHPCTYFDPSDHTVARAWVVLRISVALRIKYKHNALPKTVFYGDILLQQCIYFTPNDHIFTRDRVDMWFCYFCRRPMGHHPAHREVSLFPTLQIKTNSSTAHDLLAFTPRPMISTRCSWQNEKHLTYVLSWKSVVLEENVSNSVSQSRKETIHGCSIFQDRDVKFQPTHRFNRINRTFEKC